MKKINLILLLCFASVFCSCDEKYIDGDGYMVWFDLSTVDYKHSYNKKENEETHIIEIPASQTDISVFVDKSRNKNIVSMGIRSVTCSQGKVKTILFDDYDGIRPDYIELEIGKFSYSKEENGLFKANINANNSQEKRTIKIHLGNGLYRFSHFTLIQAGVK